MFYSHLYRIFTATFSTVVISDAQSEFGYFKNETILQTLCSSKMWFTNAGIYFLFVGFLALALAARDNSQFIYLKSVRCKHNPRLLENVTCFVKSYSRTVSKATVYARAIIPQSSIMVSNKYRLLSTVR